MKKEENEKQNNRKSRAWKRNVKVLIGVFGLILLAGIYVYMNKDLKDRIYLEFNVSIDQFEDVNQSTYYVVNNKKNVSIWNLDLQDTIERKIKNKAKDATFEKPFIIYNPYGTNTCSVNVYYNSSEETTMEYTISVEDESIEDFTRTAYEGDESKHTKHAYQLIGLIPNVVNTVTLREKDLQGVVVGEYSFTITMGSLVTDDAPIMEVTEGESQEELSNGLYAILGHDKAFNSNIYLYDNNGVIRSELPLKEYRTDRIAFIEDTMVYSYAYNRFVFVDRLGKMVRKINLGNYTMHHDFIYDDVNNNLLILANEEGSDTIEDVIVCADLDTNEVYKLVDMKELIPEAKEAAVAPADGNNYGGDELDWLHLNTIAVVNGKDIIVSSRELSTIIRLNNVYEAPEIGYFIADETVWEGTEYESVLLNKDGDFVSQAGQHSITYMEDDTLQEGQYYIYMYNNNYKGASTRPDFDWSAYVGAGTFQEGEYSYFYQYLVDENEKTYTLVKKFPIPYSSIVSSVQYVDGNVVTSSGMSHCYDEYDAEGNLIRHFNYTAEKYAYRVYKYAFHSFWFE